MANQVIRKPLKFATPERINETYVVDNSTPANPKDIPFNPNLKTALFIARDKGGCGFYRCVQPAAFLRSSGLMNTILDFRTTTPEHIMQSDIIIFQESGSTVSMEAMNAAIEMGKPIVVEIDDFLHKVSPHNEGGYGAWNPSTLYIHRFCSQIMRANAMTVSTPQLAREYFPYNKNIFVLPNFLNENSWDQQVIKKNDGLIRIGWAGGNAHLDDLKMISKVIEKIVRDYKGKVKFETMGMIKPELNGVFDSLEEFHDICPKCNYQGESVTWNGESLENYPIVLASHGWDIAVAPVINESFGNCKSDIKLKEYSAIGYPIVASKVVPYEEAKEDGCHVLLAKSFDDWYNNIKELIENPTLQDEIRENNKKWVSGKWIKENIKLYADAFQQIIAGAEATKKQ